MSKPLKRRKQEIGEVCGLRPRGPRSCYTVGLVSFAKMSMPQQLSMVEVNLDTSLDALPDFFAKQTRRGCVQELMGCEAKTEFKIATLADRETNLFYALEESPCWKRLLCGGFRDWTMNVTAGGDAGGAPISKFHRPLRCGMGACKCCCYQEIFSFDSKGSLLFSSLLTSFLLSSLISSPVLHLAVCTCFLECRHGQTRVLSGRECR